MRKSIKKTKHVPRKYGRAHGTVPLRQDVPENFRDPFSSEVAPAKANTVNWSQAEDRGEDLINERDPFIQKPERDSELPPEL